jgi:cell division protein FtsL
VQRPLIGKVDERELRAADREEQVERYGSANKYPEIAKANGIADANNVRVGATINLPVLS